jgi:hypothetical protein
MKKIFLLVLCELFLFTVSVSAQQQLNHEKRTYIAPNGNLYIQKSLPVYLRLATSSADNASTILLKSKESEKYTNPMYFDTEGKNTITHSWAVDQSTKKTVYPERDVIFEVYADGIAPETRTEFLNAPRYYGNGKIYYGKGLNVPITATDEVSGVEKIYYSINSEPYKDYSSVLKLDTEKEYSLKYYASDNVGNAEGPNNRNFIVDLTPPITKHSLGGIYLNDILSPSATISLSSSDNLSGVYSIYCHYDNHPQNAYYTKLNMDALNDGEHTLTYYAKDNVNNNEDKKSTAAINSGTGGGTYSFYVDRISPVVNYAIQGDQYMGEYKFISSRTKINLSATDNKAGVESITYIIDYKDQNTFSSPFLVPDKNGLHDIGYFGTDKVKNKSFTKTLTVYMDNILPTTSVSYGTPQFFDRDTLFINNTTKITLHPIDYQSGVQKTEYGVDGTGNTWTSSFTIPNEGYRKITFKTTDKVNNIEIEKTSFVFVDNTPPIIYTNFSIQPIGTTNKDGKTLNVYPNYTRLYIGATDAHCGTQKISYSINGAPYQDYSSPYTLDVSEINHFSVKNKYYKVHIIVKDKLGNQSEKDVEFFVGNN